MRSNTTINPRTTDLVSEHLAFTNAQPRDYQKRVVARGVDYFLQHDKPTPCSVMYNSPTGSGKSFMGGLTARILQQELNIGVGWAAMRQNLLGQAQEANVEMGLNIEGLTTISMFDKNPPTHDALGREIKMLVVDECQHDAANSMTHLHNVIRPRYVLGLSATPFRTDKLKLCFEKVVRDAGIKQLMELGFLSKYDRFNIPDWKPTTVVRHYLAEPERWGKSAMYFRTTEAIVEAYTLLKAAGVRVAMVVGDQSFGLRETILAEFDQSKPGVVNPALTWSEGGIDVLVNMFVLTEGWDCPSLKTAWVRDSQKGPTIQMAGRAFRIDEETGIKQVVQSAFTKWPIERTTSPTHSHSWVDDRWRSIKSSEKAEDVSRVAMFALSKIHTKLPDFILKKQVKKGGLMMHSQL